MCRACLLEVLPDRGSFTSEDCTFLLNFKQCAKCQKREMLEKANGHVEKDDEENGDYQETTTFDHRCPSCQHVVAEHWYCFNLEKDQHGNREQIQTMSCVLCGKSSCIKSLNPPPSSSTLSSELASSSDSLSSEGAQFQQPQHSTQTIPLSELAKKIAMTSQTTAAVAATKEDQDEEWK